MVSPRRCHHLIDLIVSDVCSSCLSCAFCGCAIICSLDFPLSLPSWAILLSWKLMVTSACRCAGVCILSTYSAPLFNVYPQFPPASVLLHGLPGVMQYLGSNSSYEKSIDSIGRDAQPADPEVIACAWQILFLRYVQICSIMGAD